MDSIEELRRLQRDFVRERNWEQFHPPKIAQMNPSGSLACAKPKLCRPSQLRTAPQASHVEKLAIGAFHHAADLVAFKQLY